MTGIQLPIQQLWADVVHGEDVKARADAQARVLDARLNPHWALDLSGWPDGAATWPTLDVSGFGGPAVDENGVVTIGGAWGPITLTDDDVNYLERTHAGVVSANVSGFTPDTALPMYEITTVAGEITAIVDRRIQATVLELTAALRALRAVAPAANKLAYFDGASSAATTDLSAFIRTLLDDANGAAAAATLGVLPLSGGSLSGFLTLHADPSSAMHAATKQYVDGLTAALTAGLDWKDNVRFKTTANVDLAGGGLANGTSHDGITAATGDRVLVASQTAPEENGIYIVPASGAASRATDADSWTELVAAFVAVSVGSAAADTLWVCTVDAGGSLGTTAVTWTQFGVTGPHSHVATDISDSTAAGRALLTAADEDAQRVALGVDEYEIPFVIDGSTGRKADLYIRIPGDIVAIYALGDGSGSLELDFWKCTFANYDNSAHPVVGDSICGGNEFTITGAHKGSDTTLTSWSPSLANGDVLTPNVNSISGFTRVTVVIVVKRT